jgi:uracil-DNA glycosylase family 4
MSPISIKNSFADCLTCKLLNAPSCILETNSEDDLSKVEVIFISENPGKDEVKKGVPLIGRAGQMFRKYFDKYFKKNFKWLLTNTVLCLTLNEEGNTGNPDDETITKCKENCFNIIDICKPKLIVLMGTSPMKAFGIAESGITSPDKAGNFFKWRGYDLFLTLHPSYINRNKNMEPRFDGDLKRAAEYLGAKFNEVKKSIATTKSGVYHYKIPDKYYSADYKLIDTQFIGKTGEVVYIFRDKDNNKVYHRENDDYICYQIKPGVDPKKVVSYNDLLQVKIPYAQKFNLDPEITYEGDLKITVKHTQDYYLRKKEEEPDIPLNVMFTDIETYAYGLEFSNIDDANDPIVMITYCYHNDVVTFVVDPKVIVKGNKQEIRKDPKIIICNSEKELLSKFFSAVRKLDPDIITGWNSNYFDMPMIINRAKKIGLDPSGLSRFGQVNFEFYQGYVDVAGLVCLDMIDLYKAFTQSRKESYSLNAIAIAELKEGKLETSSMFPKMYREDVNRSIDYNIKDVTLLRDLNNKLKHIQLQDELRRICRASFRGSRSSMGQLDSLLVTFLKERGLSSKNAIHQEKEEAFEGAFVKEPIVGLHDYIVDFDFTSLYPSIIRTLNIGVNTFCMKLKDYRLGYDLVYNREALPEKIKVIIDPVQKPTEVEVTKEQLIKKIEDSNLIYSINGCFFKKTETSFYSEILEGILQSRKVYKGKMFKAKEAGDKEKKDLYDIRQLVYKVLANSLYGILGNKVFRFFNVDCARTITLTGQEMIKNAILEANNYVDSLKTGKHTRPEPLTKEEMYGDVSRKTPYIITGDTDSLFATLQDIVGKDKIEDLKPIYEYCNKIQTYLNKDLIPEILKKHNIDIEMNKLELKNELVIKRGLFISKKHYAVNVISQEGVKADEIVAMGLDTKRSDYPSYTKECLKELFDILLKSDKPSIARIIRYVKDKENDFIDKIKKGDKTVARPVSWGKKIDDYKTLPQGVKSMENWNKLMYNTHNVGSKSYLFHVQGIDLDRAPKNIAENFNKNFLGKGKKLDTIAVPEDEKSLPPFLIPDVNKMLEFSWKDRYKILLSPLNEVKEKDRILKF